MVINANELKDYIINNQCIQTILEGVGCHDLNEHATEWRAALPNGKNKTAVCVKKENLSSAIRSSDIDKIGDIYTVVMEIKDISFGKAIKLIHNLLGLKYTYDTSNKKEKKYDPLQVFTKVQRKKQILNQKELPVYDTNCLKEYVPLPYIDWVREGILPSVCAKFNIGYSYDKKRIVIPWRKWDGDENEYLGIVGRTTIKEYDLLGIPKYIGIVPFQKSRTLYGLNENYKDIQEAKMVCVFEAEKSVLKRCSRLDNTGVSIGSHCLSEEQVKILIGLNVEIIIALDEGIDINIIRQECEKFYPIRKISYIYDRWGLIQQGSKNSPADMPNKVFEFLRKHRITYNEHERKLLRQWQEKQKRN